MDHQRGSPILAKDDDETQFVEFSGGKDDRKTTPARNPSSADDPIALISSDDFAEGEYSSATLTIKRGGRWKLEELCGHQYAHSRAQSHAVSGGSGKQTGPTTFKLSVEEYNGGRIGDVRAAEAAAAAAKKEIGKTFSVDVSAPTIKSFFFDICMKKTKDW